MIYSVCCAIIVFEYVVLCCAGIGCVFLYCSVLFGTVCIVLCFGVFFCVMLYFPVICCVVLDDYAVLYFAVLCCMI